MSPVTRTSGWRCAAALTLALAACGGSGPSTEAVRSDVQLVSSATLGPVSATVTMTPAEPRFGERIRFVFEVTADPGTALEAPEFGARLGHFRIRERKDESRVKASRLLYTIQAEAERVGINIARFPVLRFTIATGEGAGSLRELSMPPFDVEVAGLTPDQSPQLAELGAPLPPVSLPMAVDSARTLWIGAGALVALAFVSAWWWRRSQRGGLVAELVIDPAAEAARALDVLLAAGLIELGRVAEFYVRLTGIVRRFVERTTGIHAPEQTTEEFLRAMNGNAAIDVARQRELSAFLAAADLVKFAGQLPSADEIAAAVVAARTFCVVVARRPEVVA